jgi:hypothetical protein
MKILFGFILVLSLIANVLLALGLNHDEIEIAKANAARVQAYNDYRQRLIDLKAEHPIVFRDLQIPPPAQ